MPSAHVTLQRIVIAGGPRCGKSTYATALGQQLGIRVRHTDDLIATLDWSGASAEAARWMCEPAPWIIEGVAAGRAIRKALEASPQGRPCDVVRYMARPFVTLTARQTGMLKGCDTVWREVLPLLRARGVVIAAG